MNLNILRSSSLMVLASAMVGPLLAQDEGLDKASQRAADLEAQVRKLDASTVEGANVLLELIDLYHTNARGFGLIRAGKKIRKDPSRPSSPQGGYAKVAGWSSDPLAKRGYRIDCSSIYRVL